MNYQQKEWLGSWQNFEAYLNSTEPAMQIAWAEAETAAADLPMFKAGVKVFWQQACSTSIAGPALGGWKIEAANAQDLRITWLDVSGQPLDTAVYHFIGTLAKGLEGAECARFETESALQHPQFHCLLAMEPLPDRAAHHHGGLLSHLHFQYAAGWASLISTDGKLCHPMWYPTMCDGTGTLLERCNIVRAMHHLPVWKELPQ